MTRQAAPTEACEPRFDRLPGWVMKGCEALRSLLPPLFVPEQFPWTKRVVMSEKFTTILPGARQPNPSISTPASARLESPGKTVT